MGITKIWLTTGSKSGSAPGGSPVPSIQAIGNGPGQAVPRTLWTTESVCTTATGTDSIYLLKHTPSAPNNQLMVYINGLLQRKGIDYNVADKQLIFTSVVGTGYNISAFYSYNYA